MGMIGTDVLLACINTRDWHHDEAVKAGRIVCRNPTVLGELIYLTGLGLLLTSPAFLALVWLALFPAVVAYLKLVEEPELEERFGEAYLAYKREAPFLLPRLRQRAMPEYHGWPPSGGQLYAFGKA